MIELHLWVLPTQHDTLRAAAERGEHRGLDALAGALGELWVCRRSS